MVQDTIILNNYNSGRQVFIS